MTRPDNLSYLVAAHVWDTTPGLRLTGPNAGRVAHAWRFVFHRVQCLRGFF